VRSIGSVEIEGVVIVGMRRSQGDVDMNEVDDLEFV
jgi:hypothetical protein